MDCVKDDMPRKEVTESEKYGRRHAASTPNKKTKVGELYWWKTDAMKPTFSKTGNLKAYDIHSLALGITYLQPLTVRKSYYVPAMLAHNKANYYLYPARLHPQSPKRNQAWYKLVTYYLPRFSLIWLSEFKQINQQKARNIIIIIVDYAFLKEQPFWWTSKHNFVVTLTSRKLHFTRFTT